MVLNDQEVLELIKKHKDKPEQWVLNARVYADTLNALVNGVNFHKELIDKIEHIESSKRALAREKYSKDIRDMNFRLMSKRHNVFDSNGESELLKIDNEKLKEIVLENANSFKGNKSVKKYLSEYLFQLADVDANGLILLEKSETKVYPTYKSIRDIRHYEPKGQKLEYLILEPVKLDNSNKTEWRLIDDKTDWHVTEINGVFLINKDKTINNEFKEVPALILSEIEKTGTKERLSYVDKVTELMKDYARDKSILTIYKFLKGFPLHWKFVSQCRQCGGSGRFDNKTCNSCSGKGYLSKGDVTDALTLPLPKEGQPNIAPNIAGFIQPDLETWKQIKEDLRDLERLIEDTIWGTNTLREINTTGKDTATGRIIDIQPINNRLNYFTNNAEYAHNTIMNWIIAALDPMSNESKDLSYTINYGRRYIIQDPDILLSNYETAKKNGTSVTILDKLLEEYIYSKYKYDIEGQELMIKKSKVEPYVHFNNGEIFKYYGQKEVFKKQQFEDFWQTADKEKTAEELKEEFKNYINLNKLENESM